MRNRKHPRNAVCFLIKLFIQLYELLNFNFIATIAQNFLTFPSKYSSFILEIYYYTTTITPPSQWPFYLLVILLHGRRRCPCEHELWDLCFNQKVSQSHGTLNFTNSLILVCRMKWTLYCLKGTHRFSRCYSPRTNMYIEKNFLCTFLVFKADIFGIVWNCTFFLLLFYDKGTANIFYYVILLLLIRTDFLMNSSPVIVLKIVFCILYIWFASVSKTKAV